MLLTHLGPGPQGFIQDYQLPNVALSRWLEATENSAFAGRSLPRDVSTRWNSTYDMLAAFVSMRGIIDTFTERATNGLRDYELDDEEWDCIAQLVNILKVCLLLLSFFFALTLFSRS